MVLVFCAFFCGASIGVGDRQTDQGRFFHFGFPQEKIDAHLRHLREGLHDGGTVVGHIAEGAYAVEADDLYIFRYALAEGAQGLDHPAGEAVGKACKSPANLLKFLTAGTIPKS